MKQNEELASRQAFWLCLVSASAGVIGTAVVLQGVPTLLGHVWSSTSAAWAAAGGTVWAVVVALKSAQKQTESADRAREHDRQLQEREWERQEKKVAATTARLANAFSRDLAFAARELNLIIANLHPKKYVKPTGAMVEYLLRGKEAEGLTLIERFLDKLDGFEDEDVVALNAALVGWKQLMAPSKVPLEEVSDMRAQKLAKNMRMHAAFLHGQLVELNDRLILYFRHFDFLKGVVVDEIPPELVAAMKGDVQSVD